jgi:hypothetical protein
MNEGGRVAAEPCRTPAKAPCSVVVQKGLDKLSNSIYKCCSIPSGDIAA